MFACPRDNGANALQMRFREGTWSLGPDANHAFTDGALYRQCACQCKGASDDERLSVATVAQFSFRVGPVMPLRLPILILLHLPMGGDQSSHSVKRNPMKFPVWLKPGLWGAALGAIALAIVGFSQLGWRTATSADQLAQDRAETAVVAALVPFCVAKAQENTEQVALAKFRAEQSAYSRSDLVTQAGWATFGVAKTPDSALARACSVKLYEMKTS
jgi:hypothetical protein